MVCRIAGRSEREVPWDPVAAAGVGLAIDRATAEAVIALRDIGLRSIVLKGPSFDAWLYDPGKPRLYSDIDLLVPVHDQAAAAQVLAALGYAQRAGREPEAVAEHASVWMRPADRMHVDLHTTLQGIDPADVDPWPVLAAGTEQMRVGGTAVEILSEPARALHVALHAALPGESEKPRLDLERALERVPEPMWEAAAALARQLRAEAAFAAGLGRLPAGAELAAGLDLTSGHSVEAALLAESAPFSVWTVDRLARAPGLRAKLRIVGPRLLPKPEFMRVWHPVARRGRAGLLLAYLQRFAWIMRTAPRAVAAWQRARRQAR
jgi:hypothetical protein